MEDDLVGAVGHPDALGEGPDALCQALPQLAELTVGVAVEVAQAPYAPCEVLHEVLRRRVRALVGVEPHRHVHLRRPVGGQIRKVGPRRHALAQLPVAHGRFPEWASAATAAKRASTARACSGAKRSTAASAWPRSPVRTAQQPSSRAPISSSPAPISRSIASSASPTAAGSAPSQVMSGKEPWGPCSACATRSAATMRGSTPGPATTAISLGPATESIWTIPASSRLARAT